MADEGYVGAQIIAIVNSYRPNFRKSGVYLSITFSNEGERGPVRGIGAILHGD